MDCGGSRGFGAPLCPGKAARRPRHSPEKWATRRIARPDRTAGARFQAMTAVLHMPISRHAIFILPSISKAICAGSTCSTFSKLKTIVPAWTVTGPPFAQNLSVGTHDCDFARRERGSAFDLQTKKVF